MGQGILIGLFLLHVFIFLPLARTLRERENLKELSVHEKAYRKRFMLLFYAGVFLIVAGTLSYIAVKSLDLQLLQEIGFAQALASFIPTVAGTFVLYRAGLAILLLIVVIFARERILEGEKAKKALAVVFTLLILIVLARARVSHAAASHFMPVLSVLTMFLQVFWKAFWAGGVGVLVLLILPFAKHVGFRASVLASISFSKLTIIALGFIAASGAYVVWIDLKDPSFILTSDWGVRFIALALIGGAMFSVRLFQQLYIERKGVQMLTESASPPKMFRLFSYALPLEFLLGIALIFVSSFMVITTPPVLKQPLFEKTLMSQGAKITLSEHRFEDDKFLVVVTDEITGAPVSVKSLSITLHNEERGIGPVVVESEKRFDGAFVFSEQSLSPPGKWKIDITAPREGLYDSAASFAVDFPKEIEASHTDPYARTFNTFTIFCILAALGMMAASFLLYRTSRKLFDTGVASPLPVRGAEQPYGDLPNFSLRFFAVSFVIVALFLLIVWYAYGNVLKSGFQNLCEKDGGAWHQMLPTKNGKATSQTSQIGCMTFGGSYLFADEREYRYFMSPPDASVEMEMSPTGIRAGVPATLVFSVKDLNGEPVGDLTVTHERIMHVIAVGEDLETFSHIHPENSGQITAQMKKEGVYRVPHTFPKAGRYLVSVDFTVRSKNFTKQFIVNVTGEALMTVGKPDNSRNKNFSDGYSVRFSTLPGGEVFAEKQVTLNYEIVKNGEPVKNLEPYLGAAMHVAIVKTDLSKFIHTHGEVHPAGAPPTVPVNTATHYHPAPPKIFGPNVEAHVIFPEPGVYQVFGELNHEGKIILTQFLVKVE